MDKLYSIVFSEDFKKKIEKIFVTLSIASFIIHLLLIFLKHIDVLNFSDDNLLTNPIAAIYTPFSFILVYEVFLVVYYLPRSISQYIRKQYEIITLIIVRRIFKDIANLEISTDWFNQKYDLQLTYDLISTLVLFFIIYLYTYYNTRNKSLNIKKHKIENLDVFVKRKKTIALLLLPVLMFLAFSSLFRWVYIELINVNQVFFSIQDINELFFNEFFTVLIMADVLLLLISLYKTDKFHEIFRNSGFIISTILIRLSFTTDGLMNNILIVSSVVYGFLMLLLHIQFDKISVKYPKEVALEEKESDKII
jgi:hypothetical protein|tara:strand:+ start:973 stop:1896 length:924 start_codon:yes stop_codon:yes gene_type:complete